MSVADDKNALVGYGAVNPDATPKATIDIITVTNRFKQPINVTAIELNSGEGVSLTPTDLPEDITPGTTGTVSASVEQCTPSTTPEVSVTITVAGHGISVTLSDGGETVERSFSVNCQGNGKNGGGNGNAGGNGNNNGNGGENGSGKKKGQQNGS
ncbi:hypothetical protein [Halovenus halobia]|uniref:hypothetical protein n=1 Tax=Halovenus halobia TaxID=3396622 RepID=UPI003F569CFD